MPIDVYGCAAKDRDSERDTNASACAPFIKCECLLNVDKNIKTQYQDSAKQSIVLHQK